MFVSISLFENRGFSKTLAHLTQKISNLGHELLIIFDTSGNYPRLIFKPSLKEFKFKFEFGHAHPSPCLFLFLSFSSKKTDLGDLPSPSPCSPNKILARISPLSFPSWTRGGRRSPRASLCQTLSPYSLRHHHPLPTPSERVLPLPTTPHGPTSQWLATLPLLCPWVSPLPPWTPRLVRTPPTPPRVVTSPPASPSLQRPIPRDAQALDLPCTAPWPCQPDPNWPPGVLRACVAFRHARVPTRAALHPNLHGTAHPSRRHRYPAPSSMHATRPRLKPTAPGLKPLVLRPSRAATDTAAYTPGLSALRRSRAPPAAPNRFQRIAP
jgi:hypothetical protein